MAMTPAERQRKRRARLRDAKASQIESDAERLARAKAILEGPLPEDEDLCEEALRVLRSLALEPGVREGSRVHACQAILKHASPGGARRRGHSSPDANPSSSPEPAPELPPAPPPSLEDELKLQ